MNNKFLFITKTTSLSFDYPLENAETVILGVPFDSTTSYKPGARFGPSAIRGAYPGIEEYLLDYDFNLRKVKIKDIGDVEVVHGNALETLKRTVQTLTTLRKINKRVFPVLLGGEHLISYAPVKAFKPKSFIVLDAHLDLRDTFLSEKWSHACVSRRIHELNVEVAEFGVRSGVKEEVDYAKREGITYITPKNLTLEKVKKTLDELREPVYVSLDIDCLDPSIAPATGTPEPGGLSFQDVTSILEIIFREKEVIGFDIVEVSSQTIGDITSVIALKTLYHAIALKKLKEKSFT